MKMSLTIKIESTNYKEPILETHLNTLEEKSLTLITDQIKNGFRGGNFAVDLEDFHAWPKPIHYTGTWEYKLNR